MNLHGMCNLFCFQEWKEYEAGLRNYFAAYEPALESSIANKDINSH